MAVYLRENVNPIRSFAVIFITSLQYLLSLSLMSRINVIQVADGRAYIKNINAVVGRTLGFVFQYALISIHADYVLVKFAEVFAMMIAVLPAVYIHFKDYRQISFRHSRSHCCQITNQCAAFATDTDGSAFPARDLGSFVI